MQGLAAGAESLLSKGQAAVAVTVEEEVVRRGRRSTAGCRRCSWCEAVLATLLALAVAGAVALGYMWFTRVRNDSFATSESESGEGLPTPHCCFSLQQDTNCDDASNRCRPLKWKSGQKDYEVLSDNKDAKYYIYGWIAFSKGPSATAKLKVIDINDDKRTISTKTQLKNLTILSANAHLRTGQKVILELESEFTSAQVCTHKLPESK